MAVDNEALLAAVTAGVEEAGGTPPAPAPEPQEGTDGDTSATVDSGEAGEAPAPTGGEGGASGDEGSVQPAGAAGEPGATDDAVAGPVGDKPAGEPAGAEVKQPDPLNDPLPNALKRETKERIHTLVSMVKEKDTKLSEIQRDRDEILGMITETRASPEQYGQMLGYLKLVNSPNRADREQALAVMQNEVATLARMLGKPVPGVNMLEGHNDLIEEVSTGRLSQERAQEIAASRARAQYELHASRQADQQSQQTEAQQRIVAQGRQQLNALEASLKADPHYAAKKAILVKSLKPVFAQIDPRQWAATFKRAYDELPAPATLAPRPAPSSAPRVPQNTPLRAANPSGAATPAPSSALEALDFGLKQAR